MTSSLSSPRRRPVRLTRDATAGIVVAITLACGALGVVGGAVLSQAAEASSSRFAEARFLPLVGAQVPMQQREADTEMPASYDISLDGGTTASDPSRVVLSGGAIDLPISTGWTASAGDGQRWTLLKNGGSVWIYVQTATADAGIVTSEGVLRAAFAHTFVADPRVAAVAVSRVEALRAFGRLNSRSMLSYRGIYADSMFTSRFASNLYAGIRNDGTVLLVEVRIYPGPSWDAAVDTWYQAMYIPLWEAFAQGPLPTGA